MIGISSLQQAVESVLLDQQPGLKEQGFEVISLYPLNDIEKAKNKAWAEPAARVAARGWPRFHDQQRTFEYGDREKTVFLGSGLVDLKKAELYAQKPEIDERRNKEVSDQGGVILVTIDNSRVRGRSADREPRVANVQRIRHDGSNSRERTIAVESNFTDLDLIGKGFGKKAGDIFTKSLRRLAEDGKDTYLKYQTSATNKGGINYATKSIRNDDFTVTPYNSEPITNYINDPEIQAITDKNKDATHVMFKIVQKFTPKSEDISDARINKIQKSLDLEISKIMVENTSQGGSGSAVFDEKDENGRQLVGTPFFDSRKMPS